MSLLRTPTRPLPRLELVILLAALMSLMAFSTDSILPAMTQIGAELAPGDKSQTQYIVSAFLLGTGIGMLIFGPLSDSFGRRYALTVGIGLYIVSAVAAAFATSMEMLIALRLLQGIAAASTRTIAQAVTRDLYSGAEQAKVSSLIFMFFVAVPTFAPLIGQQIIALVGWRGVFGVYVAFAVFQISWYLLRQPETLAPEHRRDFRLKPIFAAFGEVARTPIAMRYIVVQMFLYGQFVAYLSSAEQLWVDALEVGEAFPLYFAGISIFAVMAGFLNSVLVGRLGMRRMMAWAFGGQVVCAALTLTAWTLGGIGDGPETPRIILFAAWSMSLFFINGLTLGNVAALAMEPLGHLAGTAAAVIGALGMAGAMVIAAPLGQAFDGTPRPIMAGAILCSTFAFLLVWSDIRKRSRD